MRKLLLFILFLATLNPASAEILQLEHEGFSVCLDCDRRGPILFHYGAQADSGTLPRESSYKIDEKGQCRRGDHWGPGDQLR